MQTESNSGFFSCIIKAVLTAVIVSLAAVFIFAFVVKLTGMNSVAIKTINQFIKVLSVFLGCILCFKGSAGIIKGVLTGAISALVIHLLFALFSGGATFDASTIIDVIFTAIVGGISGIIAVNLKKQ